MATSSQTTSRPLLHRSSAITSTPPPSTTPEPQNTNLDLPSNESHLPSNAELSEIELFLSQTLSKNTKDRHLMLRIEADLNQFLKDSTQTNLTFPAMSSYQRMLVHRIAGWYGLEHNLENNLVVVGRKEGAQAPRRGLRELERVASGQQQEPPPPSWSHHQLNLPSVNQSNSNPRLLKVESFNTPSTRPQQQFSKSYSFGGYSQQQQGQQRYYYHGGRHQLFSRTSTNNTSLSPASSGYKSTSFEYCSTPPPLNLGVAPPSQQQFLCWAVTSLEQVPPGALVLDPNTGSPFYNSDGSVYYYDPGRLPGELQQQQQNINISSSVLPSSNYPYPPPPPPHMFLPVIQQPIPHLQQQQPQLIYLPAAAAATPQPNYYNQQQQQQHVLGYYGNYPMTAIAPPQQPPQQHSCYGQQQPAPAAPSQSTNTTQSPSSSS